MACDWMVSPNYILNVIKIARNYWKSSKSCEKPPKQLPRRKRSSTVFILPKDKGLKKSPKRQKIGQSDHAEQDLPETTLPGFEPVTVSVCSSLSLCLLFLIKTKYEIMVLNRDGDEFLMEALSSTATAAAAAAVESYVRTDASVAWSNVTGSNVICLNC